MLSLIGWLNGLTAAIIVFGAVISATFFIIKSIIYKVKLLRIGGLMGLFAGLLWLGPTVDFLTILLTGKNMDNSMGLYGVLSYIWAAPASVFAMELGTELLVPEKKKVIIICTLILNIILVIFLIFDTQNCFYFVEPSSPGENLIDARFKINSPAFIIIAINLLLVFFLNGIGGLLKAYRSTGIIRKRFIYIALSQLIFVFVGAIDAYSDPQSLLFLARILMILCVFLLYIGVREVSEDKEKPKKEVRIESSLFRFTKSMKGDLTEEEVSISKEKQICLVCKGIVLKINYICPECRTFYCIKCLDALTNQENACWVCSTPFDESKPVKPFKKEEKREEIKSSEKHKKKAKIKK